MKFNKYLEETAVPEWKAVYVDYKGLKKYITACESRNDQEFLQKLTFELEKARAFFNENNGYLQRKFTFLQDKSPHEYARQASDILTIAFYQNNRHHATLFLRGNNGEVHDDFAFFRVGLYIGLSFPILTLSLIRVVGEKLYTGMWYQVLYIYGGLFLVILSLFGFGIDVYFWRRYRINYIFIFELN